jgi:hypothetical protein
LHDSKTNRDLFDQIKSTPDMPRHRTPFLRLILAISILSLLTGCGERGTKAIAYGNDLGENWKSSVGDNLICISVENFFTRDVVIHANSDAAHYELTVGPIRQRHMIVPAADYKIEAFTNERRATNMKIFVTPAERNGVKDLRIKISAFH